MKKFFKALAVVLALTLVIGTIPASAADVDFSLKKSSKIIYIDGSKGTKVNEDGTTVACKIVNKYKLSKLVKGFDKNTMDIKLKSADKTIAKTSNTYDRVYAKGIGKTNVTINVESKETGKLLFSKAVKVQVKKNATAASFVVDSAELVNDAKLGVNTAYTLKMPRVDGNGNWLDTDKRELTCDDANAVIKSTNKYNTAYEVTFTKPGTYTLKCRAFQSAAYQADTVAPVEIKVEAGYTAESVKQSGVKAIDVTFDTKVTGLASENFEIYSMINDVKIPFGTVESIAYNENVATLNLYLTFAPNTVYYVDYVGTQVGSFTAIDPAKATVKAIVIPDQSVEINGWKGINYSLVEENGIDIRAAVEGVNGSHTSFTLVDADSTKAFTNGGTEVFFTEANLSYTAKAVYTYYIDGVEKTVEGTGKISSYAPAQAKLIKVEGVVVAAADADKDVTKDAGKDVKPLTTWTMSEASSKAALQVKFTYDKNGEVSYKSLADEDVILKVADQTKVMIGEKAGCYYPLSANSEGTTTVLVYAKDSNGNYTVVIGAFQLTVKAARKATTLSVGESKNNINIGYADDEVKLTVKILDQYGDEMTGAAKVEQVSGKDFVLCSLTGVTTGETKITPADFNTFKNAGAITLKFTADGVPFQTIGLSVANAGSADRYSLELSNNALTTGIKANTEAKTVAIKLAGLTNANFSAPGVSSSAFTFVEAAPTSGAYDSAKSYPEFVYTVKKDADFIKADFANFDAKNDVFTSITKNASGAAVKLAEGTYTVSAYRQVVDTATKTVKVLPINTLTFTVKDDQAKPTFKLLSETLGTNSYNSMFEVTFDGKVVNDITKGGVAIPDAAFDVNTLSGDQIFFKSFNYTVENAALGNYVINVPVAKIVKRP